MPVRKEGEGYKYGSKGKLYVGKDAKAKAERQGRAIQASKARAKKVDLTLVLHERIGQSSGAFLVRIIDHG